MQYTTTTTTGGATQSTTTLYLVGPSGEVRRWRAFSLLAVAYFMTAVDLLIVNVALLTIGVKLHFAESNLQWGSPSRRPWRPRAPVPCSGQGHAVANALAGGFHGALWVCGLVGLTAVPVAPFLVRRNEIGPVAAGATQRTTPAPASAD